MRCRAPGYDGGAHDRAPKGAHPSANPEKSFVTSALTRKSHPYTSSGGKDPQGGGSTRAGLAHRPRRPQGTRRTDRPRGQAAPRPEVGGQAGTPERPEATSPDHARKKARKGCSCRAQKSTRQSRPTTSPRQPDARAVPSYPPRKTGKANPSRKKASRHKGIGRANQPRTTTPHGSERDQRAR